MNNKNKNKSELQLATSSPFICSVEMQTLKFQKNNLNLIHLKKVIYVYLLFNGNISVGFTDRSFLERTVEHVRDDNYKINRVVGLYYLKNEVPFGENCRSFESKLHFSLAQSLNINSKLIAESKSTGFKCDAFVLSNCVSGLADFQYYQPINNNDLKKINDLLYSKGLINFK